MAANVSLILDSLEVRRFRVFRHLQIERLGRVNLIVGKNNVGKSCLLEALWLYARRGYPSLMWELLEARDEISRFPVTHSVEEAEDQVLNVRHLFYGRKDVAEDPEPIEIGPIDSRDGVLSIALGWYVMRDDKEGGRRELQPLQPEEYNAVDNPVLGLAIQVGVQPKSIYRFDQYARRRRLVPSEPKGIRCIFIPANGLDILQIGQLWDSIALTDLEDDVLNSLRIIAPETERVNLVSNQERSRERIPIVKVTGLDSPIPLRSMGEGMNRLFGIALALVNAKDGLLLIDEIESGLHYSVQPDLWRLIFQVTERLNVQVFATSHSWDCIEAFQQAVQEHPKEAGLLIRLEEKKGEVSATVFDKRKVDIVVREAIEVR